VGAQLKDSYSESGRPSIDPELLHRILLIGYLYAIISERKLLEELRMHLAWRIVHTIPVMHTMCPACCSVRTM
jgi:transposase